MNKNGPHMILEYVKFNKGNKMNRNKLLQHNIVSGWDVRQESWQARTQSQTGLVLPWGSLHEKFWLVKGEMTIVSGYSGHGKSAFVNHIALDLASKNIKSFVCSFELKQGKLWNRFFQYGMGLGESSFECMSAFCNYYDEKIFTYDLLGSAKINEVLESSEVIFQEAKPDLFIFDNLMMLNDASEKLSEQQMIVQKLLNFAQTRNVHVILVAHPKKPESYLHCGNIRVTTPPNLYDVAGTSNMVNMVDNHISVTRNDLKIIAQGKQANGIALDKKEESALHEGDTILIRDKNRDVGDNFIKFLAFCKKFQRLSDNHMVDKYGRCNCKPYFEYSKRC